MNPSEPQITIPALKGTALAVATASHVRLKTIAEHYYSPKLPEVLLVDTAYTWLVSSPFPKTSEFLKNHQKHQAALKHLPRWQPFQLQLRGWNKNHELLDLYPSIYDGHYLMQEVILAEQNIGFSRLATPIPTHGVKEYLQELTPPTFRFKGQYDLKTQTEQFIKSLSLPPNIASKAPLRLYTYYLARQKIYQNHLPHLEAYRILAASQLPDYDLVLGWYP